MSKGQAIAQAGSLMASAGCMLTFLVFVGIPLVVILIAVIVGIFSNGN